MSCLPRSSVYRLPPPQKEGCCHGDTVRSPPGPPPRSHAATAQRKGECPHLQGQGRRDATARPPGWLQLRTQSNRCRPACGRLEPSSPAGGAGMESAWHPLRRHRGAGWRSSPWGAFWGTAEALTSERARRCPSSAEGQTGCGPSVGWTRSAFRGMTTGGRPGKDVRCPGPRATDSRCVTRMGQADAESQRSDGRTA